MKGRNRNVELVATRVGAAKEGKLQARFRRLLQKVDGLRAQVKAWRDAQPEIRRELAAYEAAQARQREAALRMLRALEQAHEDKRFTRAERVEIGVWIGGLASEIVEEGLGESAEDVWVKALYNRFAGGDFDAEEEAAEAHAVESLKAMLEAMGLDTGDASTLEELHVRTEQMAREEEAAAEKREAKRAQRKKTPRQLAAEARRADAERGAHKVIQDIYRALALALHPDLERDPVERARKEALMREVNAAHEAKDLLRLLELQLAVEGMRADAADAAEEKLAHYNRVLEEQARQLEMELDEVIPPFANGAVSPAKLLAEIRAEAREVAMHVEAWARDIERLANIDELKRRLSPRRGKRRVAAKPGRATHA